MADESNKGPSGVKTGDELQRSVEASYKDAMNRAYERAKGGQDYASSPPTAAPQSTGTAGKGEKLS